MDRTAYRDIEGLKDSRALQVVAPASSNAAAAAPQLHCLLCLSLLSAGNGCQPNA